MDSLLFFKNVSRASISVNFGVQAYSLGMLLLMLQSREDRQAGIDLNIILPVAIYLLIGFNTTLRHLALNNEEHSTFIKFIYTSIIIGEGLATGGAIAVLKVDQIPAAIGITLNVNLATLLVAMFSYIDIDQNNTHFEPRPPGSVH